MAQSVRYRKKLVNEVQDTFIITEICWDEGWVFASWYNRENLKVTPESHYAFICTRIPFR